MPLRLHLSFNHTFKTGSLLLAATLAASLCAQAGQDDTTKDKQKNVIEKPVTPPKFYVELGAAGEFDYHATKFISNGSANFGQFGAYSLPATIQSRDFSSTHDAATVDGRANFGYIVNPFLTVFTGFTYSHSGGDDSRRLGSFTDTDGAFGATGGRYDLYGAVSQYQAYAGRAGVKFTLPRTILNFIHAPQFITPYFSASAGGKYLDGQNLRFYSGTVPAIDTRIKLYDSSWVFTSEAGFGYEFKFTRNFSVDLDTTYGYDTKPERGDGRLNGPNNGGFTGINKSGDRLFDTVGLSAVYKF